jgi:hypothetical protein
MRIQAIPLVLFAACSFRCDSPGGSAGPIGDAPLSDAPSDLGGDSDGATPDTLTDSAGDTDIGPLPSWDDDDALLAWLVAVVATCPPMSYSTAPGLWTMSLITEGGCVVRHPEDWIASLSPGIFEVTADESRHVGYSIVGTYLEGIDWTEVSLGDYVVSELQKVYPDLALLSATTTSDPYGFGILFRVIVAKFELDGTRSLGVVKVTHAGCSAVLGNCALTASITWAPAAELPRWACTLAQIEATFRCPSAGGSDCDEGDCDSTCKAGGNNGGTCVGDDCMCN